MNASLAPLVEPPDWSSIRRDYEARKIPLKAVGERHGVTVDHIIKRAKADCWTMRRKPSLSRSQVISRMFGVLAAQIQELEAKMADEKRTGPDDKEAALLSTLARTLEKLIALERGEKGQRADRAQRDIRALREKLAQRIDQLKR